MERWRADESDGAPRLRTIFLDRASVCSIVAIVTATDRVQQAFPPLLLRRPLWQLIAMTLVIGSGLFLRSRFWPFGAWTAKYGGDALWALMVFLGFGIFTPRLSTLRLAAVAFTFACTIEFLQLYHAPWIEAVRSMRIGLLFLGSTFHPPDFLAYVAGIALGVAWERTRAAYFLH